MYFHDRLTLDSPRRDNSGNLVASVLAARTGCQDYAGYEVGRPDLTRVTVYRPADEVFSRDSMRSFAGAPVTIEHPSEPVNPGNWKDHAVGETSEEIVRDGEAVRVPFLLRDAAGIAAVEAGKREISMGYECSLTFEDGEAPDGTPYQAVQRGIRINHLAIVDRARGGPSLRISDQEKPTMKIKIGDAEVDATNGEAVRIAVDGLNTKLSDATIRATTAETQVATLTTDNATLVAEKATLTQQLTDAKLTPQALRDAAKAYQQTVDKAKVMGVAVTDAMDDAAIRKAVVAAKLGDAAKDWTDAQIAASFATLTADAKADTRVVPIGAPLVNDAETVVNDARAKMLADLHNPTAAAA